MVCYESDDESVFKGTLASSELLLLLLQQLKQNGLFCIFANNVILCHNRINQIQVVFMRQIPKGLNYSKMNILLIIGYRNKTEEHDGLVEPGE